LIGILGTHGSFIFGNLIGGPGIAS
jgi:hypothetical protein